MRNTLGVDEGALVGLGPGESNVGWGMLAFVGAFFGFTAGCVGIAWSIYGDASALSTGLGVAGMTVFVGGLAAYLPLSKRDYERDHRRAIENDPPGFDLPLSPGSPVRTGRIWALHVISAAPLLIFWSLFVLLVRLQERPLILAGWFFICGVMSVAVYLVRYAVLVEVVPGGLRLRGMLGTRTILFCDIQRWTIIPMRNGLPHAAALYRQAGRFSPGVLVPLFDVRLAGLLEREVGPIDSPGHT